MDRTREPGGTPSGGEFTTDRKAEVDVSLDVPATEYDEDGYALDEWGQPYGYCNDCGEEASAYTECCDGGEVVPALD